MMLCHVICCCLVRRKVHPDRIPLRAIKWDTDLICEMPLDSLSKIVVHAKNLYWRHDPKIPKASKNQMYDDGIKSRNVQCFAFFASWLPYLFWSTWNWHVWGRYRPTMPSKFKRRKAALGSMGIVWNPIDELTDQIRRRFATEILSLSTFGYLLQHQTLCSTNVSSVYMVRSECTCPWQISKQRRISWESST